MQQDNNWIKAEELAIVRPGYIVLTGTDNNGPAYSIIYDADQEHIKQLYSLLENEENSELQLIKSILDLTGENISQVCYQEDPKDYFEDRADTIGTLKTDSGEISRVKPSAGMIPCLVGGGEIYFNKGLVYKPEDENYFDQFLKATEFFDINNLKNVKPLKDIQWDKDNFIELTISDIEKSSGVMVYGNSTSGFPYYLLKYTGDDKILRSIMLPDDACIEVFEKSNKIAKQKGYVTSANISYYNGKVDDSKDTISILNNLLRTNNCHVGAFIEGESQETGSSDRIFIPSKAFISIDTGDNPMYFPVEVQDGLKLGYLFDNLSVKEERVTEIQGSSMMPDVTDAKDDTDLRYIG